MTLRPPRTPPFPTRRSSDLGNVAEIDFENIFYYIKPTEKQASSWEDLPSEIKDTWDKLGIPEGRRSEEHTSELQSLRHLVCRLLLEKKKHMDMHTRRECSSV